MRAGRGLKNGALVGMGAGIATALAVAVLIAVSIFTDDNSLTGALVGAAVVGFFGSLIGGIVGAMVGTVLGLVFGVTGSERLARWITPVLLLLVLATTYAGEFSSTIGFSDGLAILTTVGALGALGFAAGAIFEKLMAEPGHLPVNLEPAPR
jgi:outer membrane lipoprotein SlyB